MKKKAVRAALALLLAALLGCAFTSVTAFAAGDLIPESEPDPAETPETVQSAAPFVMQGVSGRAADTVFWAGAFLALGGTLGLVLLVAVSRVTAARSVADGREEVLDEIEEARQLAKQREASQRRERSRAPRPAVDPKADTGDLPAVRSTGRKSAQQMTLEDFLAEPMTAEEKLRAVAAEKPAVPMRVEMEMEDVYSSYRPKHEVQKGAAPRVHPAQRPAAQKPLAQEKTAEEEPAQRTDARPAAVRSPSKQYDVDEILREVRENRL